MDRFYKVAKRPSIGREGGQRGVVLIIGMIFLLLLTIVGIGSMSMVTMNELMTTNMHNQSKAFHGAEAGLTHCEVTQVKPVNWINVGDLVENWWQDSEIWATAGIDMPIEGLIKSVTNVDGLVSNPLCVIEYVGDVTADQSVNYRAGAAGAKALFRLTANAPGADARTEAIVESIYVCGDAVCVPNATLEM